MTRKERYL